MSPPAPDALSGPSEASAGPSQMSTGESARMCCFPLPVLVPQRKQPGASGLVALVAVLVYTQPIVASAGAVTPGKNGLLLLAAPEDTAFAGANAVPAARAADCSSRLPNELWTVRSSGGGLAAAS